MNWGRSLPWQWVARCPTGGAGLGALRAGVRGEGGQGTAARGGSWKAQLDFSWSEGLLLASEGPGDTHVQVPGPRQQV